MNKRQSQQQRSQATPRNEQLVRAFDTEGEHVGWVTRRDCELNRLSVGVYEPPVRYKDDPYVRYHARLGYKQGIFRGSSLNEVQKSLLISALIQEQEEEAEIERARMLHQMLITNPEMYKAYREKEEQEKAAQMLEKSGIEWRTPSTPEEVMEMLADVDDDFLQELEQEMGLDDETKDQMSD